jgi:hypothetical protein
MERRSLRTRFRERRYTPTTVRVGLGCALIAAVSIVQFGSNSGADTAFVPGTASAVAQAISLSPTTGGLNYSITLATSLAQYENAQSQALSQTIDLGTIGTALEAEGCNNAPPTLPKKDVPPPVQAESIDGNQTVNATIVPSSTATGIGVGNESATATTQPASSSSTTTGGITLPGGLLTVSGLTSSSHVEITNGSTRLATATSSIGSISLAHGAVVLSGMQWTATQQSGATTSSKGTFTLGSLKVAGNTVALPALPLTTILNIINTVLTPIGFNIQWPAQTTLTDGTVGISPLLLGIDNNVLGQEIVGANLGTVQPVRQALVNAILNADCNLASEITVSDIGVGVLAGGGNLNLELGGANAVTTDAASVSPFGTESGSTGAGTLPIDTGNSGGLSTLPFSTGTTGVTGTTGSGGAVTGTGTGAPTSKLALGPTSKTVSCISLGPAGGGCNKGNPAVPIGLVGLGLVVALFTWDYIRQRRRARMAGQEVGS